MAGDVFMSVSLPTEGADLLLLPVVAEPRHCLKIMKSHHKKAVFFAVVTNGEDHISCPWPLDRLGVFR